MGGKKTVKIRFRRLPGVGLDDACRVAADGRPVGSDDPCAGGVGSDSALNRMRALTPLGGWASQGRDRRNKFLAAK